MELKVLTHGLLFSLTFQIKTLYTQFHRYFHGVWFDCSSEYGGLRTRLPKVTWRRAATLFLSQQSFEQNLRDKQYNLSFEELAALKTRNKCWCPPQMEALLWKIIRAAAIPGRSIVHPLIDCFHLFGGQQDPLVSAEDEAVAAPVWLRHNRQLLRAVRHGWARLRFHQSWITIPNSKRKERHLSSSSYWLCLQCC